MNKLSGQKLYAPAAKILVVDDNEFNLTLTHELLSLLKLQVQTAFSGREAIELIQQHEFDLVLMDYLMPEMDGIATAAAIRNLAEAYRSLPIIALTANEAPDNRTLLLSNAFNDLIVKPLDFQVLTEMLKKWLPTDKMKAAPETTRSDSPKNKSDNFWERIAAIGDINTEIGLSRVSGLQALYRDALTLFHRKLPTDCEKMQKDLNERYAHGFAISVHAIKSTLAAIGAMSLSQAAFRLETAGKNKDLAYCEIHFPAFKNSLLLLHKRLSGIFTDAGKSSAGKTGDIAEQKKSIQAALRAADHFDSDAGSKLITGLLAFDFGEPFNSLLNEADCAFHDFDYEGAIAVLQQIQSAIRFLPKK